MVRKRNVFNVYEYDYEERWINELAGEGLLLTEKKKGFYCFEESDNTNRRYCIIPKKKEDFGPEEITLYLDMGWEPAFTRGDRTYFYTDDPDAPALFTDETSYADYLKKNRKDYMRRMFGSFFIVVIWTLTLFINLPGQQTSLSWLANRDLVSEISFFSVYIICIGLNLIQGIGFHNCRLRIEGRKTLNWNPNIYARRKARQIISNLLLLVLLASIVPAITGGSSKIKGDDIYTYDEPYPVLLRNISAEEWDFVRNNTDSISLNDDKGVKFDYELHHASNLTLKDGYSEEAYYAEAINYSDWELPEYTSLTYEFRSEKTAEKLLKRQICNDMDMKINDTDAGDRINSISIDISGADYAGYYEVRQDGSDYQYLYLRKGTRIVYARYNGKKKLLELLPLFEAQLK